MSLALSQASSAETYLADHLLSIAQPKRVSGRMLSESSSSLSLSNAESRKLLQKAAAMLPKCNKCGIDLQPLGGTHCSSCGRTVMIFECPSCLSQDEWEIKFGDDICQIKQIHSEHSHSGGRRVTSEDILQIIFEECM
jgi:uncharacterized Zn finger protein (UPF0148 family)